SLLRRSRHSAALHSFPTRRSSDLREWRQRWALRRYGFHGLSHAYCSGRAAELAGAAGDATLRIVTCHLGAGASLAAVRGGVSVRSEEHTSELQSRVDLVCRLLLEK